tara:strand:- start:490 stop:960 length:471 start_codon:yes stop_codon:yes gene_type:complete
MANTTFSGPIRAGNIRNTVGTTVGTDVANVGYVIMGQGTVVTLTNQNAATYQTNMVIPANSRIVNVIVDLSTAANTTTNISIGDTVGGNTTIVNALASGTSAGLKTITTQGGGTGEWDNIGTTDLKLTVTSSANTTTGIVNITVMYMQAFHTVIQP